MEQVNAAPLTMGLCKIMTSMSSVNNTSLKHFLVGSDYITLAESERDQGLSYVLLQHYNGCHFTGYHGYM